MAINIKVSDNGKLQTVIMIIYKDPKAEVYKLIL